MGKVKFVFMVACILIGGSMIEGFTNGLGAILACIAVSMASYHDGIKDGKRELLTGSRK